MEAVIRVDERLIKGGEKTGRLMLGGWEEKTGLPTASRTLRGRVRESGTETGLSTLRVRRLREEKNWPKV